MSEKKTGLGRGLTSLLGENISVVSELKNDDDIKDLINDVKVLMAEYKRPKKDEK